MDINDFIDKVQNMNVIVRNRSTVENLNRLRRFVFKHPKEQKISILIDPLTGEISLPQPIQEFEIWTKQGRNEGNGFEHVTLFMHSEQGKVMVELLDESDHATNLRQFATQAILVLEETLKIINQFLGPKYSSVPELFLHLDSVRMELNDECQMRPEWHGTMQRKEAEQLLEGKPIGIYLLRQGDIETEQFEESLMHSNREPFRCYVVTFVGKNQKIVDRLLIQRSEGWALYDDDPDLNHYIYKNLADLLQSMGLRIPMIRQDFH